MIRWIPDALWREYRKAMVADASLASAMRDAFPHFQDDAPVTPEAIRAIGREYNELVMDPGPKEMEFADQSGTTRTIVYEEGDASVGIAGGWVIGGDWEVGCASCGETTICNGCMGDED